MDSAHTVAAKEKLFASTRWTLVLEAGRIEPENEAGRALSQLCTIYWRPVYLFLRRQGYSFHDSEDLTQEFFAALIQNRFYTNADPQKGRFRSYLLGTLKHFLANRKDYQQADKRGGRVTFVRLADTAEQEIEQMIARSYRLAAEQGYEREWAITVLRRAISILEEEWRIAGKAQLFDQLKGHLGAEDGKADSYGELSRQLSRSVFNLRKDVSRLRRRYRALLREEVRHTVANDAEVDAELRHLRAVMAA